MIVIIFSLNKISLPSKEVKCGTRIYSAINKTKESKSKHMLVTRESLAGVAKSKLHSGIPIPTDRYQLRCKKEKFEKSAAGNGMIKRIWEVVSPDITIDGNTYVVAGIQVFQNAVLEVVGDAVKTANMQKWYLDDQAKLGLDGSGVDPENPKLEAEGIIIDAVLEAEAQYQRKAPKPGQQVGDVINGANGKPLPPTYQTVFARNGILGRATDQGSGASGASGAV